MFGVAVGIAPHFIITGDYTQICIWVGVVLLNAFLAYKSGCHIWDFVRYGGGAYCILKPIQEKLNQGKTIQLVLIDNTAIQMTEVSTDGC